jgi:hypothetical protein
MQKNNILFIGLDTHKVSTEIAYTKDARSPEVQKSKSFPFR